MHARVNRDYYSASGRLNSGMFLQKVQCFLVHDLVAQAGQSGFPAKDFADFFHRLVGFSRQSVRFRASTSSSCDLDLFLFRDILKDQRSPDIAYRLLALVLADLPPVHVEPLRIDALARKFAHHALHAGLDLPIDQSVRALQKCCCLPATAEASRAISSVACSRLCFSMSARIFARSSSKVLYSPMLCANSSFSSGTFFSFSASTLTVYSTVFPASRFSG